MSKPIAAVIVAARSDFPPESSLCALSSLGETTLLERAVGLFRAVRIGEIAVVLGKDSPEEAALAADLDTAVVTVADPQTGLRARVCAGLGQLPKTVRGAFILPVTVPLVRPATLRRLISALDIGNAQLARPVFRGASGLPVLCGADLFSPLDMSGAGGLEEALSRLAPVTAEVAVADAGVLRRIETGQDLSAAGERLASLGWPDAAECQALFEANTPGPEDRAHCRAVAEAARRLAEALLRAGRQIDPAMAMAGGLLHDLAKGRPNHAALAARILQKNGFGPVAPLVVSHPDLDMVRGRLKEKEIVYLADKLIAGTVPVTVEERFRRKLESLGADHEARSSILLRLENARVFAALFAAEAGESAINVVSKDFPEADFFFKDDISSSCLIPGKELALLSMYSRP